MNRRKLLAAAPTAVVLAGAGLGGAIAAPNPDAGLLVVCTEFHRLHTLGYDGANPAWEAAMAERWGVFQEIKAMLPSTDAGHRAKAAVAVAMLAENHGDGASGDPFAAFALTMLQDWLEQPSA